MAKGKKGKNKGGGKGIPRWLLLILGGVAVAGVMGAFDRFVNYDKNNHWVKGVFLAGAAVAGAFLLRKTKLISAGTANVIGGAGLAMGGYVALGPKVYEIGNNIANSFAGMFKGVTQTMGGTPQISHSPAQVDTFSYQQPTGLMGMGPAAPAQPVTQAAPPAQTTTQPAQTIVVQQPKTSWMDILGTTIQAGATIAGAALGGSKGDPFVKAYA